MQCFIYKSLIKNELYLYLETKEDFSKVPDALLKSFGKLQFVMELEITTQRKLAREDANKVLSCLKETGFFVQLPPKMSTESLTIKNSKLVLH